MESAWVPSTTERTILDPLASFIQFEWAKSGCEDRVSSTIDDMKAETLPQFDLK